jgi:hypothetical protein
MKGGWQQLQYFMKCRLTVICCTFELIFRFYYLYYNGTCNNGILMSYKHLLSHSVEYAVYSFLNMNCTSILCVSAKIVVTGFEGEKIVILHV